MLNTVNKVSYETHDSEAAGEEAKQTVYIGAEEFIYVSRDSVIKNYDGSLVFNAENVMFPPHFSQNAIDIMTQKYFRRAGVYESAFLKRTNDLPKKFKKYSRSVPNLNLNPPSTGETSAHQVFHRLAGCWTYWGCLGGYFKDLAEADQFYLDCYHALYYQHAAPNSPQWFNTGLFWAYGISSELRGTPAFYYDKKEKKVVAATTSYERPQPHACFIQSISDGLVSENGIMDLFTREATVFKYGSGSGTNYSNVRGKNEKLGGGGKSSGLMSFLRVGDASAGSIKSGGTTRRAARLVVLDMDHPEIEEYIEWKVVEENKVAALVTGSKINKKCIDAILNAETSDSYDDAIAEAVSYGVPNGLIQRAIQITESETPSTTINIEEFDTAWEGIAYSSVNGQNANNSVSVRDNFLYAMKNDLPWDLIGRRDGDVMKTVSAKKLWRGIAEAAWSSADPGILYYDIINSWNTCENDEAIRAANPCCEYFWFDDTACNLASLNLVSLYHYANKNIVHFTSEVERVSRLFTTVLDISIEMAQFPSPEIARKTWEYRTLGLGYANIGSLIMRMGYAYGSEESKMLTESVTALMGASAYLQSSDLAAKLVPFPAYKRNVEPFGRVMDKHTSHAEQNVLNVVANLPRIEHIAKRAADLWYDVADRENFRNAQVTVIAPTGTIGLVMDCDTTGIEPDFSLIKTKKLAGGGYIRITNKSVEEAMESLGIDDETQSLAMEYAFGTGYFPSANAMTTSEEGLKYVTDQDLMDLGVSRDALDQLDVSKFFNLASVLDSLAPMMEHKLHVSDERMANTQRVMFGRGTLEGFPFANPETENVFVTAALADGATKAITALAHMEVMAAAQKYISGGISKTINLPYNATVDDIQDVYETAYTLGIKAVSVYRDGSKLSQPLMSSMVEKVKRTVNSRLKPGELPVTTEQVAAEVQAIIPTQLPGTRRRPPNKRTGYTQKGIIAGHKIYHHVGEFADGTLGEIYIDMAKEGSTLRAIMNNFAISVSIGLQYGVPLTEYVEAFTFTKFEPAGMVQNHDNIKMTTSILDFVFRDLAINYLDRDDLANIKPEPKVRSLRGTESRVNGITDEVNFSPVNSLFLDPVPDVEIIEDKTTETGSLNLGFTGDICSSCHMATMKRTGTCSTCSNCGNTSGCS